MKSQRSIIITSLVFGSAVMWMAFGAMGCTVEERVEEKDSEAVNFCVVEEDEAHESGIEAGEPLQLYAIYSCGTSDWEASVESCDVEDVDGGFEATTYFEFFYERDRWDDHVVNLACNHFYVECGSIGSLEEGEYTFEHGEVADEFSVPSDDVLDCQRHGMNLDFWRGLE